MERQNEQCMILHFNLDKCCVSKKESTDFILLQLSIYVGMITRMEVQKKWGKFRIYAIKGGGAVLPAIIN